MPSRTLTFEELVAHRIAARRREVRMSLARVAKDCGVSLQQIHRYEIGANAISITMLWRIAKCLGTDLTYFVQDAEASGAAE